MFLENPEEKRNNISDNMRKIWDWIKNVIGWAILLVIAIIGLAAGLIFAGYIMVYVIAVFFGIMLIIGLLYLILKLIGFK